jgi:plastocyanin
VVLLLVAGCAGSEPPAATAPVDERGAIAITTTDDFRFVPAAVTARVGQVRIVLKNAGSYPHNISFPDLHATSKTVSGTPGSTTTELVLTVAHAGRYRFVCTFHDQAGMTGSLDVTS